ncbi:MAG: hypothetical protein WKG00_12430 [Polyangiaceae bacterium]
MIAASRIDSVEEYGRLMAALADPFGDENAVLGRFGLTRARYAALQQEWATLLATAGGGSELARRFSTAYAVAHRAGSAGSSVSSPEGTIASSGSVDEETLELVEHFPRDVLPFQAPSEAGEGTADRKGAWR